MCSVCPCCDGTIHCPDYRLIKIVLCRHIGKVKLARFFRRRRLHRLTGRRSSRFRNFRRFRRCRRLRRIVAFGGFRIPRGLRCIHDKQSAKRVVATLCRKNGDRAQRNQCNDHTETDKQCNTSIPFTHTYSSFSTTRIDSEITFIIAL